jgi:hypothetical protein
MPIHAQEPPAHSLNLEVGTTIQVVSMERSPLATGVAGHATWWATPRWGLRGEIRRDVGVQRDIREALFDGAEWGEARRFNGTVALVWEALPKRRGRLDHSLRLHAGPTVQRQRDERARALGTVSSDEELLRTIRSSSADNVYLDEATRATQTLVVLAYDVRQVTWGASVGASYGIRYGPASFRVLLSARNVQDVDGTSLGVGGGLSFSF